MPRGLRFSTAVHRTFSNNFRTRKNPISQARKRPGSYPILPPPRAIPNPIPTTPKPDLPVKNGDPGLKTGYFFTLSSSRLLRMNSALDLRPSRLDGRVSRVRGRGAHARESAPSSLRSCARRRPRAAQTRASAGSGPPGPNAGRRAYVAAHSTGRRAARSLLVAHAAPGVA